MKKITLFCLLFFLLLVVSCGGVPGNPNVNPTTTTSNLSLQLTETASNEAVPLTSASKGSAGDYVIQPAEAVASGSVRCVSTDSAGTKTTRTGVVAGGIADVVGIPSGESTICYLLNSAGSILATIPISDSGAVGSIRDGFKMIGGKTINSDITYNSNAKSATAACPTDSCQAPASGGTDAVDYMGTWKMNCNGIKREDNDTTDSSQSCPAALEGTNVYLHRVKATDSGGTIRYGYGAWPSLAAFQKCGSTEGLQDIPSGWTLSTSGQTGDFTWTAPFGTFISTSTSAQISTMIQNVTSGPALTFLAYQSTSCDPNGLSSNACAADYFWAQIFPYINANPAAQCWPRMRISYDSLGAPTFSPAKGFGGKTQPANRYDFMSAYSVGDRTYMKSFYAEEFSAYNRTTTVLLLCDLRDELLVSMQTLAKTPTAGTQNNVKFTQTTSVAARSGVAADTTRCRDQLGYNNEWATKGTYVDITMTFQ